MKVHHLNCGSLLPIEPLSGPGHPDDRRAYVCHCLLIEADESDAGLVLVDTGFGTPDIERPHETIGADFVRWAEPALDPDETALRQVVRLGYNPSDVQHIIPTHLHRDHVGGLADFPWATVHVGTAEYEFGLEGGMPQAQRAHDPHWSLFDADGRDPERPGPIGSDEHKSGINGERWFGFDGVHAPDGLPPEILVVPLPGHTPGHTGVAIDTGHGWLLHTGDAYYYGGEINADPPAAPEMLDALQASNESSRDLRITNRDRLRALAREHADEVRIVCAHDPWEFSAAERRW